MSLNHMQKLSVVNNISGVHYEDINNVCRSCLSKDVKLDLFYTIYEGNLLSEIYKSVTLIQVKGHDGLSSKLCISCIQFLVQYHYFRTRALNSEIILQKAANEKVKEQILSDSVNGVDDDCIIVEVVDESGESNANAGQEEINENQQSNAGQEEISENQQSNAGQEEISENQQSGHEIEQLEEEPEIASEKPNFTCSFCGSDFKTFAEYRVHRKREARRRMQRYPCPVCQKLMFRHRLAIHMCIHTNEHRYQCEICQKMFKYEGNLSRHRHLHNKKKPHTCDLCGKGFVQATVLKDHLRGHASEKTYMCDICGKLFVSGISLAGHLLAHKVKDKKERTNVCENELNSHVALKKHRLTHSEKQFLCSECGKTCKTKTGLQVHIQGHTGEKPFVCQICNKRFAQSTGLKMHIRTHTGEKPVVCTICGKRFTQRCHMKRHMQWHTGDRPFTCTYCNKSFTEKSNLAVHVRMHTGEKPYVCDICHKPFYDNGAMKKHRKTHETLDSKKEME